MKAMLTVLGIGVVMSLATNLSSAEAVRAFTPFTALSTVVMLLAYWVVADDHTPSHANISEQKKAA
jgi:uncharacterized membrane protein YjfL (UPF0719 family)